ncbi:MAG TPA: outer membrane beta-barrel protein [Myxococcota bacterium]|nr:outer membrane beta-barrel protein [Myxococcota bacterium]
MRYLAIASLFLVSTFAAHVARADDKDPYERSGGYVGVGGTYGIEFMNHAFDDALAPLNATTTNSWGAHGTAGYQFSKWISTEVEYEWMKGFNTRAAGVAITRLETQTATLNLKVHAPYRQFQPYVLVGAGAGWISQDKNFFGQLDVTSPAFVARFGAGLDYYFTPSFFLNVGSDFVLNSARVSQGGGKGRGLDYLATQIGFGYRF